MQRKAEKDRIVPEEKERTKERNQTTENTIVIVISSVKLILPPVRYLAFPKICVPAVSRQQRSNVHATRNIGRPHALSYRC
jgi:hypothetical protein